MTYNYTIYIYMLCDCHLTLKELCIWSGLGLGKLGEHRAKTIPPGPQLPISPSELNVKEEPTKST